MPRNIHFAERGLQRLGLCLNRHSRGESASPCAAPCAALTRSAAFTDQKEIVLTLPEDWRSKGQRVPNADHDGDSAIMVADLSEYFRLVEAELERLLSRVTREFPEADLALTREFINHGEYGLALDVLVDVLTEDTSGPIAGGLYRVVRDLADRMQMDGARFEKAPGHRVPAGRQRRRDGHGRREE